jgi:hypothetical protein
MLVLPVAVQAENRSFLYVATMVFTTTHRTQRKREIPGV